MPIAVRPLRLAALALLLALGGPGSARAQPAPPPSTLEPVETVASICGTREITIADMRWPSASILAHIHQIILAGELGCETRIVDGDTASTGSSMATTQQPAIAPEMWISRIPEIWNSATLAGSVRPVANTYLGGPMEGWFIPKFLADEHPELAKAEQLFDMRGLFGEIGKSRFVSCPPDWACSVINRNLVRALRLHIIFKIEEPANRFELDQLLSDAISRRQRAVFYYWQPNAAISQFGLRSIELGLFNPDAWPCLGMAECETPLASAFPAEPVVIAIASWLQEEAPIVVDYLQQSIMPLEEMNRLLAQLSEEGGTPEGVAREFYETRQELWSKWLPASLN
ncbi:MAG: glycine betaine ABC transporter substrate-binding protein [Cucumibacter sp.]